LKFYDFIEKRPPIGTLVVIEGTERTLADRALEVTIDRVLPPELRDMNLARFSAAQLEGMSHVREAVCAMPFLASSRVVVVSDTQTLKAAMRRELWEVAEAVPEGNTLVFTDLLSPRAQRPQPFGAIAGRRALRIDTTAGEDVRTRFVEEELERLGVGAEPRVIDTLARSNADLAAVQNDLEKLALISRKITIKQLQQESLAVVDPKAYQYAGLLVEGRTSEALGIARELFANDSAAAAVPLIYALATECALVWELARDGGRLPARSRWRERVLRPVAAQSGERRARRAYERAIDAFDAIVTGRMEDPELAVDLLSAEVAGLFARGREEIRVR